MTKEKGRIENWERTKAVYFLRRRKAMEFEKEGGCLTSVGKD